MYITCCLIKLFTLATNTYEEQHQHIAGLVIISNSLQNQGALSTDYNENLEYKGGVNINVNNSSGGGGSGRNNNNLNQINMQWMLGQDGEGDYLGLQDDGPLLIDEDENDFVSPVNNNSNNINNINNGNNGNNSNNNSIHNIGSSMNITTNINNSCNNNTAPNSSSNTGSIRSALSSPTRTKSKIKSGILSTSNAATVGFDLSERFEEQEMDTESVEETNSLLRSYAQTSGPNNCPTNNNSSVSNTGGSSGSGSGGGGGGLPFSESGTAATAVSTNAKLHAKSSNNSLLGAWFGDKSIFGGGNMQYTDAVEHQNNSNINLRSGSADSNAEKGKGGGPGVGGGVDLINFSTNGGNSTTTGSASLGLAAAGGLLPRPFGLSGKNMTL